MIPLEQFTDNDETAYEVRLGRVSDITAPRTQKERVTKRQVREMFAKFVLSDHELHDKPRSEQIREFNLARQDARRPLVSPEILVNLLV
jgi:hypothetical protein